ncbi:S1 RNA-binding domain-containing protein [Streptomyces sp. NPDC087300]|uniref:S1 RNA-binding domain-containing protein n=1 Tax=Streptomyces sp. NPDC087300 TaxID=3365780 RepID=UPI00382EE3C2
MTAPAPHGIGPEPALGGLWRGRICKGTVTAIAPFGAFVTVNGTKGLLRLPEIAREHIDHPSDVLRVGDEVTTEVLMVDLARAQLILSRKALLPDP